MGVYLDTPKTYNPHKNLLKVAISKANRPLLDFKYKSIKMADL